MPHVLFDATRLFVRGSRYSPTGIDRVVLAYAQWFLQRRDVEFQPVVTGQGRIWRVPRKVLADLVERSALFRTRRKQEGVSTPNWSRLIDVLVGPPGVGSPLRPPPPASQLPGRALWHGGIAGRALWSLRPVGRAPDSLYVNVSHTGLGDARLLGTLTSRGSQAIVMLHDIIPITHPEYCAPGASDRHVRRLENILGHAALVIANSRATAEELGRYAGRMNRACPETVVAPLGVEEEFLTAPAPLQVRHPYFVCVGTIEARKNHAFLLALWRQLDERLGRNAPHLVLVGRRGWENESALDHLQRSASAARLVHEVSDLQDWELARLVAGANALLAPSVAEGYDLPVVEAAALGTHVIASDIPVHREVGGAAEFLDPLDGPGWLRAIEAAIDRAACARKPADIAPSWADHFAHLNGTVLAPPRVLQRRNHTSEIA